MNNTIEDFAVGDHVQVVVGPFRGLSGRVVEVHRPTNDTALAPSRDRYLVSLSLRGRDVVVDFSPDSLADELATSGAMLNLPIWGASARFAEFEVAER